MDALINICWWVRFAVKMVKNFLFAELDMKNVSGHVIINTSFYQNIR